MQEGTNPQVDAAIWALRPDFAALSITARGLADPGEAGWVREALERAVRDRAAGHAWADGHLEAWREAYRAFGAKPQRTPCSAEALRRRAERDGAIPSAGAVVDLYNAVSLDFAIPVGGEDLTAYAGVPRLVRADGTEPFDTVRDGAPAIERPDPGEVVWRDDRGVTCRRWNWRQGVRTRIGPSTTDAWFVLERLAPMPIDALLAAGEQLASGLSRMSPGASIVQGLIQVPRP
ncbi:B3/B4 domain-containing protein [Arenibaculum pallidiluteum]|uniref:B3/B4 domain-containing protein n=1 Tax=Arenibaculum pallidiluteum TaxID=2812559 RepID=UPI001A96D269|nr:phenylalanine--tRNA ligase beta subunit-related protein [Arenibaculum pallidiluteum]